MHPLPSLHSFQFSSGVPLRCPQLLHLHLDLCLLGHQLPAYCHGNKCPPKTSSSLKGASPPTRGVVVVVVVVISGAMSPPSRAEEVWPPQPRPSQVQGPAAT